MHSTEPTPHHHLPPADALRAALQAEALAQPSAQMGFPVQLIQIVVLHEGVDRAQELTHLASLPGQKTAQVLGEPGQQLRLQTGACTVKWQRHAGFSCYTIMRALAPSTLLNDDPLQLLPHVLPQDHWVAQIPGQLVAAVHLVMLIGEPANALTRMSAYSHWFPPGSTLASQMGRTVHSCALTDFAIQSDGFERILLIAKPGMGDAQVGRVVQRLLDLATYRLMALRGLLAARAVEAVLSDAEQELVALSQHIADASVAEAPLLQQLLQLAGRAESLLADLNGRLDASAGHYQLLLQRIAEMRESPVPGNQTLGEFVLRSLAPAMDTTATCQRRLLGLSERTARSVGLLRVRMEASRDAQGQRMLDTLDSVQRWQKALHRTGKLLALVLCSWGSVSLLGYVTRVVAGAGAAALQEQVAAALTPFVIWAVWRYVRQGEPPAQ